MHPEDRKSVEEAIESTLNEHHPYSINHRVVRQDGTEIIVHEVGEVTLDDSGKPVEMIGTVQDITEPQRMEQMIRQSDKMISVGGLAAGMAHELNNPLGSIIQSLQNINRRLMDPLPKNEETARELGLDLESIRTYMSKREIPRMLDGIKKSGERASGIVANMLRFSRKLEAIREPVNIPQLVDDIVELASLDYDLKKEYRFRDIEIVREIDPALPTVICVSQDIEQVLLNILRNAAEALSERQAHGEKREIVIRVNPDEDMIRFDIEDNGIGMHENTSSRIFEPFFTTKPPGGGVGLGLSVAYFIVCIQHEGRMEVNSTPGEGTTLSFWISTNLPLHESEQA